MFITIINISFEIAYLSGSQPGPGGPPMVYQQFLVFHREFLKFLIRCSGEL